MDEQVGKPITDAQRIFGFNYIERQLKDGDKVYTWHWSREGVTPGYETPTTVYSTGSGRHRDVTIVPGTYFPPTYHEQNCEFSLIVDAGDRVKAWRAHGNGCPSYPGSERVLHSAPPA